MSTQRSGMSRQIAAIAVGALAAGLAGWHLSERRQPAAQPAIDAAGVNGAELAALRTEIASLKDEARAARERWKQMPAPARAAAAQPAAPEGEPELSPAEARKAAEARNAELNRAAVTSLEARMVEEGVDMAWSTETEREIQRVIAALPGTKLEEVDCAATLCKVSVSHVTREDQRSLAEVQQQEPFQQGIFLNYDREALRTTLFVLRKGASFRDDREEDEIAAE